MFLNVLSSSQAQINSSISLWWVTATLEMGSFGFEFEFEDTKIKFLNSVIKDFQE
jgi:hypothetical protein